MAFDFLAILSEGRLKGKSAVRYLEYIDSLRQKDDLFMLEIEREKIEHLCLGPLQRSTSVRITEKDSMVHSIHMPRAL